MSGFSTAVKSSPLHFGLMVGLVLGLVNLALSWLYPLADDTPRRAAAVCWTDVSPVGVRVLQSLPWSRTAVVRCFDWILTVAFATFLVSDVLILLRVNLFLNELTGRDDWQSASAAFGPAISGAAFGLFVNLDYLKQAPLKAWGLLRHWRNHGRARRVDGGYDVPMPSRPSGGIAMNLIAGATGILGAECLPAPD